MSRCGSFTMSPAGPYRSGSFVTLALTYTAGPAGLREGGMVKFALPNNGWGEPLPPYPRECPELRRGEARQMAGWARCNTTWRLERREGTPDTDTEAESPGLLVFHRNSQNIIGRYDNWSWWITAVVESGSLAEGDRIVLTYGDTAFGEPGARVQRWEEASRVYFSAFADPAGGGAFTEVEGSPVEAVVVPGSAERCVATIPSVVRPGAPYALKLALTDAGLMPVDRPRVREVRVRDAAGDETTPRGLSQDLFKESAVDRAELAPRDGDGAGEHAVEEIAPGGHAVEVVCGDGKRIAGRTNPSLCRDGGPGLFWGDLHCHSFYHMYNPELGYGHPCLSPTELIAYARDVSHLDFVALTDGRGALPENAGWEEGQRAVIDSYRPGEFVTLKGWEVQFGKDGHRNVIYREARVEPAIDDPAFRATSVWSAAGSNGMEAAHDHYRGRTDVMLIPHHTMAWMNWAVHDAQLDRLVEIYSCWGSSEHENNSLWSKASPSGRSVRHALSLGYRLGFVGGSDSHTGYVGRSIPLGDRYRFVPYKAGLTGVWSDGLTREAVFDALRARRCFATTGARMILEFEVDGHPMGTDASGGSGRGVHSVRWSALCPDIVTSVEIIRDGRTVFSSSPRKDAFTGEWEDRSEEAAAAAYYYLKLAQADGNTAWASPVWV